MRGPLVLLGLSALFAAGCVPVTEPIGDVDKSTPDKALVGTWEVSKRNGLAAAFSDDEVVIDVPAVKGNPKGLMRAVMSSESDGELWFFVTTFDKRTYANMIQSAKDGDKAPRFGKEGVYAKWQEEEHKRYFVFRYSIDGDTLTVNAGNYGVFTDMMKDAKVRDDGRKHVSFFYTEPKWADTIFAKGAADKVYDNMTVMVLKRKKK